jgi:prophage antirepressor-like protein
MVGTKDEPWFCGRDVCNVMEYNDYRHALSNHVKSEDKKRVDDVWGRGNR